MFTEVFEKRRNVSLPSMHGIIVANPGEGGNFIMKNEIMDILTNTDDDVVVLDVFGEIGPELDAFGAEPIYFAPNSGNHINPLYPEEMNPFSYEVGSLVAQKIDLLFAMINATGFPVTAKEKYVIDTTLAQGYRTNAQLNLSQLISLLEKETSSSNIMSFAQDLKSLTCLQGETNINYDRRCTVVRVDFWNWRFNVAVSFAAMEHLLWALYEKYMRTKKRTWVYIPSIDALVAKDSVGFIRSFWKKARKFSIICTGTVPKYITKTADNGFLWTTSDCIYLMVPGIKDEDWFDIMDAQPVGLAQMMYRIGDEIGSIGGYLRHNPFESDSTFFGPTPGPGKSTTDFH